MDDFVEGNRILRAALHGVCESLQFGPLCIDLRELDPLDLPVDVADVEQVMIEEVEPSLGAEYLDPDNPAGRDHGAEIPGCSGTEAKQERGRIVRLDGNRLVVALAPYPADPPRELDER